MGFFGLCFLCVGVLEVLGFLLWCNWVVHPLVLSAVFVGFAEFIFVGVWVLARLFDGRLTSL